MLGASGMWCVWGSRESQLFIVQSNPSLLMAPESATRVTCIDEPFSPYMSHAASFSSIDFAIDWHCSDLNRHGQRLYKQAFDNLEPGESVLRVLLRLVRKRSLSRADLANGHCIQYDIYASFLDLFCLFHTEWSVLSEAWADPAIHDADLNICRARNFHHRSVSAKYFFILTA